MKTNQPLPVDVTEEDIRAYAYHLFEQSGGVPGRDLDNWLEAEACLRASIPTHESHTRLHRHLERNAPAPEQEDASAPPRVTARTTKGTTVRTTGGAPDVAAAKPRRSEPAAMAAKRT